MRRVETGPMQFGEDWPGLFLRGDDCLNCAIQIETLLEVYKFQDVDALFLLENLLNKLKAANAHSGAEATILKPFDQCLAGNDGQSEETSGQVAEDGVD